MNQFLIQCLVPVGEYDRGRVETLGQQHRAKRDTGTEGAVHGGTGTNQQITCAGIVPCVPDSGSVSVARKK